MNTSTADKALPADDAVRPRKRWRWSTIFGVLVLVLIVTLAGGWIGFGVWARHRLNTQLAAIRDAGEPMTWRDLSGPVETTEAGREYIAAFQRMVEIDEFMNTKVLRYKLGPGSFGYDGEDEGIIDYEYAEDMYLYGESAGPSFEILFEADAEAATWDDGPPDDRSVEALLARFQKRDAEALPLAPEDLSAAADVVRPYEAVFARLERAGSMEPCLIDLDINDWEAGNELKLARSATELLALRGYVQLEQGRIDAAAETALTILHIHRIIGNQRHVIVHLTDRAIASHALLLIAEVLSFDLPSPGNLQQIQAAISEIYDPEHLTRAMMGERISSFELFESARRTGEYPAKGLPGPIVVYFQGQYLQFSSQIVAGSRRPFPEVIDAMTVEPTDLMSNILVFPMAHVAVLEGNFLASLRSVKAAIAIEQHRRAHGSLPQSLAELVPSSMAAELIDPFTGKPLHYRVEESRYVIYSVGGNGTDEDGALASPPRGKSPSAKRRPTPESKYGCESRAGSKRAGNHNEHIEC